MTDINSPPNSSPTSIDRGMVSDIVNTIKPNFIIDNPDIITPYIKKTYSIIMWDHPVESGITLSIITFCLLIIRYCIEDLPALGLSLLYWITFINFIYATISKLLSLTTNAYTLPNMYLCLGSYIKLHLSDDQIRHGVSVFITGFNHLLKQLTAILLIKDFSISSIALIGLYIACILSVYLSFTSLLFLSTGLIFTIPIVYHQNREFIDTQRDIAVKFANEQLNCLLEKSRALRSDLTTKINAMATSTASSTDTSGHVKAE